MDPAHTGGTGTPAPGGLTSALQREILWHLKGVNAIGGDVVEVSPPYDAAAQTAIVGAIVAMDISAYPGRGTERRLGPALS
jgi:agmatinase